MGRNRLQKFLSEEMSMTEVYQPVIIKELLKKGGNCTKRELALALLNYDYSFLEYYKKILMRWPKETLSKHGIVKYKAKGQIFSLNKRIVDLSNCIDEISVCDLKIKEWLYSKKNRGKTSVIKESTRYKILRNAKGKCELCGIPSSLRPIDIDHIVPRSNANKYGKVLKDGKLIGVHSEENLQALCFKCNRAKRASDKTDFRRNKSLSRDFSTDITKSNGKNHKKVKLTGKRFLHALNEKLIEEHEEYLTSNNISELVNMLEVIFSIAKVKGVNESHLLSLRAEKKRKYGGFEIGLLCRDKE